MALTTTKRQQDSENGSLFHTRLIRVTDVLRARDTLAAMTRLALPHLNLFAAADTLRSLAAVAPELRRL